MTTDTLMERGSEEEEEGVVVVGGGGGGYESEQKKKQTITLNACSFQEPECMSPATRTREGEKEPEIESKRPERFIYCVIFSNYCWRIRKTIEMGLVVVVEVVTRVHTKQTKAENLMRVRCMDVLQSAYRSLC